MAERFIGQVQRFYEHSGTRAFAGYIYDTTRRRAATGDMAQDFAFADITEVSRTRSPAEKRLAARLAELNAADAGESA